MSESISIREFARRLGVTDRAVRKAIQEGKIEKGVITNEKDQPAILPEVASAEWLSNHNPAYGQKPDLMDKLRSHAGQLPSGQLPPELPEQAPEQPEGKRSIAELKRIGLEVKIQREAIRLRVEKGELVDKKKVYAALYSAGQEVRTALMVIPDRTIDTILAARDRNEAHQILTNAIHEALTSVSDIQNREILK